jgi:phosphoribosylformylglycinamidine synthase
VAGVAGSHYEELLGWQSPMVPLIDKTKAAQMYKKLHRAINASYVHSAHDLSEGGLAVALSECAIGSGLGAHIQLDKLAKQSELRAKSYPAPPNSQRLLHRVDSLLFGEAPASIIVTVDAKHRREFERIWSEGECIELGEVTAEPRLVIDQSSTGSKPVVHIDCPVSELIRAWTTKLPFD